MDGWQGVITQVECLMQAVAALAELAIPHFTTRTIFSVANLGSEAKFYVNVQILAVSRTASAPETSACTPFKHHKVILDSDRDTSDAKRR